MTNMEEVYTCVKWSRHVQCIAPIFKYQEETDYKHLERMQPQTMRLMKCLF